MSAASPDPCKRLLHAVAERSISEIEACFAPTAVFRVLTPHQLREEHGQAAIAARYAYWLAPLEPYALESGDVAQVSDRVRIRYRFLGRDPVNGWQLNEHTGYATVEDGAIVALNVACAGFRPTPSPQAETH